jgi:hypothetical protein
VTAHLAKPETTVEEAIFVLFGAAAFNVYNEVAGAVIL